MKLTAKQVETIRGRREHCPLEASAICRHFGIEESRFEAWLAGEIDGGDLSPVYCGVVKLWLFLTVGEI